MKNERPNVNLFNRQRGFSIETECLEEFLKRLSGRLEQEEGVSVVLVSDKSIQRYNARFAGRNYPTDVLSFPADQPEESYLGDIIISVETADRQRRGSLETELKILCLHGYLHLLGYDHVEDSGEMESLEMALREEFCL